MRRKAPRRQIFFDTAETDPQFDYTPAKARDKRWAEVYKGKPAGTVVALLQRIGSEAASSTFSIVSDEGSDSDLSQLASVLSLASIGTAYHTFGTPSQHELMYRQIELPVMMNPETKERTTKEALIEQARGGLSGAAVLADEVVEFTRLQHDTYKSNQKLGRQLAQTGFLLATIAARTYRVTGDETDVQFAAWKVSRNASVHALEMTGAIGARPTVAQIADAQSPLRRYLYDNQKIISSDVHGILAEEVGRVAAAELTWLEHLAAPEDKLF